MRIFKGSNGQITRSGGYNNVAFSNGKMKFISGKFLENQYVTVEIDGEIITRKVRYNHADGLYIMYKNYKYFEFECEYWKENEA